MTNENTTSCYSLPDVLMLGWSVCAFSIVSNTSAAAGPLHKLVIDVGPLAAGYLVPGQFIQVGEMRLFEGGGLVRSGIAQYHERHFIEVGVCK